jgi:hypothetical protein
VWVSDSFVMGEEELLAVATIMEMLGKKRKWGGLVPRHVTYDRDRIDGDIRHNNDFFVGDHSTASTCSVEGNVYCFRKRSFQRLGAMILTEIGTNMWYDMLNRFRMRKSLFLKIVEK